MNNTNSCHVCESIHSAKGVLYDDGTVIAMLSSTPATVGHMLVTTKEHHPILEQVPDQALSACFELANKMSIAVFEGLGAQGTNLLIENGTAAGQKHAHFLINVIPRKEGDGIDLQWQAQEAGQDVLESAATKIDEALRAKPLPAPEREAQGASEAAEQADQSTQGKDDHRLAHLKRLP